MKGEPTRTFRAFRTFCPGPALLLSLTLAVLSACGGPTSPDDPLSGAPTPSGAFLLRPGNYGPPTDEHLRLFDLRWFELQQCLRLHASPSLFKVDLRKNEGGDIIAYFSSDIGPVGGRYHPSSRIEVLGDTKWTQSWKHEQMHLLLDMTEHNYDGHHTRGGLIEYSPGRFQGADWLRCTN